MLQETHANKVYAACCVQTDTWTNNYHISSQKQTGTKKEHVIKNEEDRESKQTQTDVKKRIKIGNRR